MAAKEFDGITADVRVELPEPGTRVDGFLVERRLSEGGMGHVLMGRDVELDRLVALKFLHRRLVGDPRAERWFLREARSLAGVEHPGIVRIFSVGDWHGWPYLAMEFVEGTPLSHTVRNGPLPLLEALRIAEDLASALAAVHTVRIAHRDVNPANVLIRRRDASICLIDFGLARSLDRMTDTTSTVVGTPYYMAPEQLAGRPQDLRVDVYAFGATLFELLTGRAPHEGVDQSAFFHVVLHVDAPALRTLRAEAPVALEALVARALARAPELRHADARQLVAEVRSIRARVDVGRSAVAERPDDAPQQPVQAPTDPSEAMPLVGRDEEYAAIVRALAGARDRRGALVLLEGEPGAGKSRLLRETERAAAAHGLAVMRIDGGESRASPYAALRDALSTHATSVGIGGAEGLVALVRDVSPGSGPLLPTLGRLLGTEQTDAATELDHAALVRAALAALRCLVRDRPAALLVDDLHHLDEGTVRLIGALAERASSMPVAMVLAFPPAASLGESAPLAPLLPRLRASPGCTGLTLSPLGESAVARMIQTALRLSEAEACRLAPVLHRRSAGNALYVTEALELLEQEGRVEDESGGRRTIRERLTTLDVPPRMLELALRRIAGLPAEERETLGVVAVEPEGLPAELIGACREVPRLAVLRVLQHLVKSRGLVRQQGESYAIAHAEIRDAVYGELIPELAAAYHDRIAAFLRERGEDRERPARYGRHLERAGRRDEAVAPLLDAGRRALAGHAPADALSLLDAAVRCAGSAGLPEAQVERARALEDLGELAAARATLAEVARRTDDVGTEARLRLARFERNRGHDDRAWEIVRDADSEHLPTPLRARLAALAAQLAARMGRAEEALAALERAGQFGGDGSSAADLEVSETRGVVLYQLGRFEEAKPLFERAVALAERLGVQTTVAIGFHNLSLVCADLGDRAAALEWAERAVDRAAVLGAERVLAFALLHFADLLTGALRLTEAEHAILRAREAVARLASDEARYALCAREAGLELARGEPARAIEHADRGLAAAALHPLNEGGLRLLRAEALLGLARPAEALAEARRARTALASAGTEQDCEEALAMAARALREQGVDGPERAELRALAAPASFSAAIERALETSDSAERATRFEFARGLARGALDQRRLAEASGSPRR